MFLAAPNLVKLSVAPCNPWDFKPTENLTPQIRKVKEDRQAWYQTETTKHNFYTAIEAHSSNQRVSKENPPKDLWGAVADYDISVPRETIDAAIAEMPIKPTYLEKSLGGNFRLVWVFEKPIRVDTRDFCTFLLQAMHDWLKLDLLPGLDRKAFEETSRLYCNGCEWEAIGDLVSENDTQAFFVDTASKFRFNAGDDALVPLDLVEKALHARYPKFEWPGMFELGSQGPTFWIPESVSPKSALVKEGGMLTYAAHAGKPFYTWTDLLGPEFTAEFQKDAISKATKGIYWDGNKHWMPVNGIYRSMSDKEFDSYLTVDCKLSMKPGQNGVSPFKAAHAHIYRNQWVSGAGPFALRRPGLFTFQGQPTLNTYFRKPIEPSAGSQVWGPNGTFRWASEYLTYLLVEEFPLHHWLAWWKYFYESAINYDPMPGQNCFFLGAPGCGKTLASRNLVGPSVGGYADASDFLVRGEHFNSYLFEVAHWSLDDDNPMNSTQAQARLRAIFKKTVANQQFLSNKKFENAAMVEWMGRIFCTTNLDFVSTRIIGPLDDSSLDKTNVYRCPSKANFPFPSRTEIVRIIAEELPRLLRWLLDWKVPDYIERDSRYGFKSYQEKSLMDHTHQTSFTASFNEILISFLQGWFASNPKATCWEGSVSILFKQLMAADCNEIILKSMKVEQVSRYLEQIQREGYFKIESRTGAHKTRLWKFHKEASSTTSPGNA